MVVQYEENKHRWKSATSYCCFLERLSVPKILVIYRNSVGFMLTLARFNYLILSKTSLYWRQKKKQTKKMIACWSAYFSELELIFFSDLLEVRFSQPETTFRSLERVKGHRLHTIPGSEQLMKALEFCIWRLTSFLRLLQLRCVSILKSLKVLIN